MNGCTREIVDESAAEDEFADRSLICADIVGAEIKDAARHAECARARTAALDSGLGGHEGAARDRDVGRSSSKRAAADQDAVIVENCQRSTVDQKRTCVAVANHDRSIRVQQAAVDNQGAS